MRKAPIFKSWELILIKKKNPQTTTIASNQAWLQAGFGVWAKSFCSLVAVVMGAPGGAAGWKVGHCRGAGPPSSSAGAWGAGRGWAGVERPPPSPARRGRPPPPSGPLPTSRPPPPAPLPRRRTAPAAPPPPALRPLSPAPSRSLLSAIEGRRELQPVNRAPPLSRGATAAAPPAPRREPRAARPGASPGPARPAPTRAALRRACPRAGRGARGPALEARTRRPRGARPGARGPRPRAPCPRPRPALRSPAPLPGLSCGTDAGPPASRVSGQWGAAGRWEGGARRSPSASVWHVGASRVPSGGWTGGDDAGV